MMKKEEKKQKNQKNQGLKIEKTGIKRQTVLDFNRVMLYNV